MSDSLTPGPLVQMRSASTGWWAHLRRPLALGAASLCLWSAQSTYPLLAQADQVRIYLPVVQPPSPPSNGDDQALELLARHEDLALCGSGLGVPDTRQPAMDTAAGLAYLIACSQAGDHLAVVAPGTALPALRRPLGYEALSLHVAGDYLVVLGSEQPNGYDGDLLVRAYRVSSTIPPQLLGQSALKVCPWRVVSSGGRLYVAGEAKLHIVDLSDPEAIHPESVVDTGFAPDDIAASDDGLVYLAREHGIDLIDARQGGGALHRDILSGFWHLRAVRLTTEGRYLLTFSEEFVKSGLLDGKLTVYDIATPERPVPVGSVAVPSVFDWDKGLIRDFGPILFALDGDLLLVAAHELVAVDVSTPERPVVVARAALPHRALGLGSGNQLVLVAEEGGTLASFRLRLKGSVGD